MFMTKCHANIYMKKPLNEKLFVQRWKDKENILIWTISMRFREPTNCSIGLRILKWGETSLTNLTNIPDSVELFVGSRNLVLIVHIRIISLSFHL